MDRKILNLFLKENSELAFLDLSMEKIGGIIMSVFYDKILFFYKERLNYECISN